VTMYVLTCNQLASHEEKTNDVGVLLTSFSRMRN